MPEVRGERRPGAPDLLVRLPAGARHDRRRTRLLQRPRGHAGGGARDEPGAQAADAARAAGTRSGRTARPTTGCRAASRRRGRARRCRRPAGPPPPAPRPPRRSSGRSSSASGTAPCPGRASAARPGRSGTGRSRRPSVRSPASGTSRETIVASCARAGAGRARASPMRMSRRRGTAVSPPEGGGFPFRRQEPRPSFDRILTATVWVWRASHAESWSSPQRQPRPHSPLPHRPPIRPPRVLVAEFENDVNPVTQDFLLDAIERGEEEGYKAVVIEMDTPGGLSSSMRGIVKGILAADVPVVVYVAPPGASADSAGAVIGMSADVLAMAPQTNIGSSTPVSIGGEDISTRPAPQDRQRRGRLHRRARARARPQRPGGARDGHEGDEPGRP